MKKYLSLLFLFVSLNSCVYGGHPPISVAKPVIVHSPTSVIGSACGTTIQYKPTPASPEAEPINVWTTYVRYQGTKKIAYNCSGTLIDKIDSTTFLPQPIQGGGPQTMYQYAPVPLIPFGKGLEFDANIAIPASVVSGGQVAQYYLFIYLSDGKGHGIAYTGLIFDSRCPALNGESAATDGEVDYISTFYTSGEKYSTLLSGQDTCVPFATIKPFNIAITASQLSAGIQAINNQFHTNLNMNAANWSLSLIGYGAELTNSLSSGSKAMIQFNIHPIGVYSLQ